MGVPSRKAAGDQCSVLPFILSVSSLNSAHCLIGSPVTFWNTAADLPHCMACTILPPSRSCSAQLLPRFCAWRGRPVALHAPRGHAKPPTKRLSPANARRTRSGPLARAWWGVGALRCVSTALQSGGPAEAVGSLIRAKHLGRDDAVLIEGGAAIGAGNLDRHRLVRILYSVQECWLPEVVA